MAKSKSLVKDYMTKNVVTVSPQTTTEEVTEEATTAAKNNTASNVMDADDGYIFPDADTSYVSKSSVKKLSDEELQYAVNEIYARHGLKFTKKVNKERFEKKAWYNGTVDDQDSISLNKYEKKNVDTMAAELKKRGILVTAVCPGPVRTEFFDRAGALAASEKEALCAEPEAVVTQALTDSVRGRRVSVYGAAMKGSRILSKILPDRLLVWGMMKINHADI
jgi:hypothetical protein